MKSLTIGILGGGQLGRMLALAGYPLGLRFRVYEPAPDAPAGQMAEQIAAAYGDQAALERFAAGVDVVTYEFENVPVAATRVLQRFAPIFPPPAALEAAQDRLVEKRFFNALAIPTAPFSPVDDRAALDAAIAELGLPAILKTRRLGYDGKGQALLRDSDAVDAAWRELGGEGLILEGFVPFARELSLLAVRGQDGAIVCYPLVENVHRDGILRRSIVPAAGLNAELQVQAETYARRALEGLEYVGVLAIELFEVRDSAGGSARLLANEMAPRVHNSGHWTIEGAATSQFENHVRAICGLPLGSVAPRGHAAMVNIIGEYPDIPALLQLEETHVHLYGKAPRPGRKIGHVTVRADNAAELATRLAEIERVMTSTPML